MVDKAFHFPVRVYYEDTDAGGVVYHANYLKFMERARSEWLINLGCSVVKCEQEYGILFVVKQLEIDFSAAARLGDVLRIETKVLKLGKVGMTMQQVIYNAASEKDDLLICSALVKLASVKKSSSIGSGDTYSLAAMPIELSSRLSEFQ